MEKYLPSDYSLYLPAIKWPKVTIQNRQNLFQTMYNNYSQRMEYFCHWIPHADHKMVSVQIVDENAPNTGPGRWSIPAHLIRDGPLLKYIKERGKEAQQKVNETKNHRTVDSNPQTIYAKFKRDVLDMAWKRERAIVPKLIQEIQMCECELKSLNNNMEVTTEEKVIESEILTQKLTKLKRKQHLKIRSSIAIKNRIEGETMTRSWIQNNKIEKPRDIIYALRKPQTRHNNEQNPYEKDSQEMAKLARNYHEKLELIQTKKQETNVLKRPLPHFKRQ